MEKTRGKKSRATVALNTSFLYNVLFSKIGYGRMQTRFRPFVEV